MSKKASQQERQRQQQQAARDRDDRLLFTRAEVARLFGISVATVIRLEANGKLSGLKLGSTKNFRTLYKASEVLALAGVEVA